MTLLGKWKLGVFILLTTSCTNAYCQLPGSGKDINFGSTAATNPCVILSTFPNQTSSFTITAWIKTTNNTKIGQRIFEDDEHKSKGYGFSLSDPGTGRLRFYSRGTSTGSSSLLADGSKVLANNAWYYVAAVINTTAKTVSIYVNGVLDVSVSDGRTGTFGTDPGNASFGGETPSSGEAGNGYYIHGEEDEVIIWNSALTQSQLRDAMCAKQSATNPGLTAYWNLDYATAANVPDLTSNIYNGVMSTGMVNGDVITSGAAIGDVSMYDYSPATWTGVTLTLPAALNGTVFSVSNVLPASGGTAPTGVQMYQVNAVPNTTVGITGLGGNNVYYGVYVINGTSPKYNATLDYSAYNPTNTVQVFYRLDNSITSWTAGNTNPTPPPYSITESGVTTRDEFILGSTGTPLPVGLLSFTASCNNNAAVLQWSTATETNNKSFTLERSADGINFETVATIAGTGNSSKATQYTYTDYESLSGISYYRLSQTDFDGNTTLLQTIPFTPCAASTLIKAYSYNSTVKIQINDATGTDYAVSLYDISGRLVSTTTYQTTKGWNDYAFSPEVSNGIYILRVSAAGSVYTKKLVIER